METALILTYILSMLVCGINSYVNRSSIDDKIYAKVKASGKPYNTAGVDRICTIAMLIDITVPVLNTVSAIMYLYREFSRREK